MSGSDPRPVLDPGLRIALDLFHSLPIVVKPHEQFFDLGACSPGSFPHQVAGELKIEHAKGFPKTSEEEKLWQQDQDAKLPSADRR